MGANRGSILDCSLYRVFGLCAFIARAGAPFRALSWLPVCLLLAIGGHRAQAEMAQSPAGPQFRVGLLQHDLDGYGGTETGSSIAVELRGARLSSQFWKTILSPRPLIGANINDSGDTSNLYAGLSWAFEFESPFYVSFDFGGAVHNGKLKETDPKRAALGSRVLFREALEVGVVLTRDWRVGIRLDHMSNANLAENNDGITNLGILITRQF